MESLKKIIHPHKSDHHAHDLSTHSTTTTTDQQHSNILRGSDTGENIANPFSEPNTQAADRFRQHNTANNPTGGTHHPHHVTEGTQTDLGQHSDRGTAHGYGTGVGAATGGSAGRHVENHHNNTTQGAGAGMGGAAELRDSYGPGVNTGGARVVEARMPTEEGNNFPGTNPNPAHNALGTGGDGGLMFPGGQ